MTTSTLRTGAPLIGLCLAALGCGLTALPEVPPDSSADASGVTSSSDTPTDAGPAASAAPESGDGASGDATAGDTTTGDGASGPPPIAPPEGFPLDACVFPGSTVARLDRFPVELAAVLETDRRAEDVVAFYRAQLKAHGWEISVDAANQGRFYIHGTKGIRKQMVELRPHQAGTTIHLGLLLPDGPPPGTS